MTDKQKIVELISRGNVGEALSALNDNIAAQPDHADWIFLRGKAYWRLGEKGKAISDYETAVQLDPNSPAHAALELSRDVMDFFNPDIFNP